MVAPVEHDRGGEGRGEGLVVRESGDGGCSRYWGWLGWLASWLALGRWKLTALVTSGGGPPRLAQCQSPRGTIIPGTAIGR